MGYKSIFIPHMSKYKSNKYLFLQKEVKCKYCMNNFLGKFCRYLKVRHKILIFSAFHAVWVLFLCYLLGNVSYSLGDEESFVQYLNITKEQFKSSQHSVPDDVLVVNIAYDKELVDISDEYGIPAGQIDITDRSKLLCFLQSLRASNSYKYILLDVFFDKSVNTVLDSALFTTIAGMERIVIPRHKGFELANSLLADNAAYSDYCTSINEGNFVKYNYCSGKDISIPLQMYTYCSGESISCWGPFYFCNGRLCKRCIFLNFPVRLPEAYNEEGGKNYYNLGSDLLDMADHFDITKLVDGKFIVIGNMVEDDIHDTHVGPVPGALINFNAFLALLNGEHYVSWWSMSALWIVYFLITVFLMKRASLFNYLPYLRRVKSKAWQFVFSWFGLSTLLFIVCGSFYFLWGEVHDILIISTYFSLFSMTIQFYYTIKKPVK